MLNTYEVRRRKIRARGEKHAPLSVPFFASLGRARQARARALIAVGRPRARPRARVLARGLRKVSASRAVGSPGYERAAALFKRAGRNLNDVLNGGDYFKGMSGPDGGETPAMRFVPFNGGVSRAQLAWLRRRARRTRRRAASASSCSRTTRSTPRPRRGATSRSTRPSCSTRCTRTRGAARSSRCASARARLPRSLSLSVSAEG